MTLKLVALDLDGTIVNEDLAISAKTHRMIQRLQDENIRVIVATGRMFPSTLPFAKALGITDPVISYQGGMIREITPPLTDLYQYPILYHQPIDLDVAHAIIDLIQAEDYPANVYVNDRLYISASSPHLAFYHKISGVLPETVSDFHTVLTSPPSKIMIIDDRCDAILALLAKRFPTEINLCKSRYNFCEIVHPSVSKWTAIEHLLDRWNIDPTQVMAIGDQGNDLSMILGAGIGVAMGNAPESIQSQARYITDTLDLDGAANAIENVLNGIALKTYTQATP